MLQHFFIGILAACGLIDRRQRNTWANRNSALFETLLAVRGID